MGLALATAIGTWYVLPHEPPGDSYGTEKRVFKDWNKNELFEHFPTVIFGNLFSIGRRRRSFTSSANLT